MPAWLCHADVAKELLGNILTLSLHENSDKTMYLMTGDVENFWQHDTKARYTPISSPF